ncbi:MAG: complex I subunit 5 family protein [Bacilli bacterium]
MFTLKDANLVIIKFSSLINFGLKLDGLGMIFASMVSILWPIALIYLFEYMKHDENRYLYTIYYVATYGVVLGISFSSNLFSLYIFYELLTFITLPLIIHYQTKEAKRAGRYYLYFSLSGSSLALAGLVLLVIKTGTCDFTMGGSVTSSSVLMQLAYLFTFFGFGVKSATFPLCYWLPMAGAAPTPTTALLHAVAVVKAGAFAIIRVTYYNFSYSLLQGSWAQHVALCFISFTIIYGSIKAVKEQHLKRRFAYSTIANLSYILFGALLCSLEGLRAALLHFLIHSITKIAIFFVIGAINETAGTTYVYETNGLGKKMPLAFVIFTLSGLSLIGIPPFGGFISKFYLIKAGFALESVWGYLGIGALIISALLSIIYVFSITSRAFVRSPLDIGKNIEEKAHEISLPFLITSGMMALLSLFCTFFTSPLMELIQSLIGGI